MTPPTASNDPTSHRPRRIAKPLSDGRRIRRIRPDIGRLLLERGSWKFLHRDAGSGPRIRDPQLLVFGPGLTNGSESRMPSPESRPESRVPRVVHLPAISPASISELEQRLAGERYVADRGLAVSLFLALRLNKPLFLEGEAGVGKTSLAAAAAAALDADLIRLQCYEGLDVAHAVYEWDYARQLLELRILEATGGLLTSAARRELYNESFLMKRPLLQAIDPARSRSVVLLIDEIDRADEEFEGYLLELLAEFQITIPELGTIRAATPPLVILTSNRTREVHDALKRRCLYQWIEYPTFEKEMAIVHARVPHAAEKLTRQVTALVHELRGVELYKVPGVSETLDWVAALAALNHHALDIDAIESTLGVVLKAKDDIETVRGERLAGMLQRALAR
jgi:MoxR-like ATPase